MEFGESLEGYRLQSADAIPEGSALAASDRICSTADRSFDYK